MNERALRFVFNEKQTSYCELLNRIGLPSLENQRLAKIVSTVFNVINNEHAPRSIKDLIGLRNNNYNLRGSDILKQPKASTTTYGLKSGRFIAPKLWNLLPDSSRINQILKAFKKSYQNTRSVRSTMMMIFYPFYPFHFFFTCDHTIYVLFKLVLGVRFQCYYYCYFFY